MRYRDHFAWTHRADEMREVHSMGLRLLTESQAGGPLFLHCRSEHFSIDLDDSVGTINDLNEPQALQNALHLHWMHCRALP